MRKIISIALVLMSFNLSAATLSGKVAKTSGKTTIAVFGSDGSSEIMTVDKFFVLRLDDDKYYTIIFSDEGGREKYVYVDTNERFGPAIKITVKLNKPHTILYGSCNMLHYVYYDEAHNEWIKDYFPTHQLVSIK